jgi:hypothetical protein
MNELSQRGRLVSPPSALHPSPGFHRRDLPAQLLCRSTLPLDGRTVIGTGTAQFVVTTPDVRARVKLDLIFVPDAAVQAAFPDLLGHFWGTKLAPVNLFDKCALWLTKRGEPGIHGGHVNVENLLGDIYDGEPIPEPGCLGYHVEAETCAEELWGRVHFGDAEEGFAVPMGLGVWYVRAAAHGYEQMSEGEWERVVSRFAIRVEQSCVVTGELPPRQPG